MLQAPPSGSGAEPYGHTRLRVKCFQPGPEEQAFHALSWEMDICQWLSPEPAQLECECVPDGRTELVVPQFIMLRTTSPPLLHVAAWWPWIRAIFWAKSTCEITRGVYIKPPLHSSQANWRAVKQHVAMTLKKDELYTDQVVRSDPEEAEVKQSSFLDKDLCLGGLPKMWTVDVNQSIEIDCLKSPSKQTWRTERGNEGCTRMLWKRAEAKATLDKLSSGCCHLYLRFNQPCKLKRNSVKLINGLRN